MSAVVTSTIEYLIHKNGTENESESESESINNNLVEREKMSNQKSILRISSIVSFLISIVAVIIALKRNKNTNIIWKICVSIVAFLLGIIYIIYAMFAWSITKLSAP